MTASVRKAKHFQGAEDRRGVPSVVRGTLAAAHPAQHTPKRRRCKAECRTTSRHQRRLQAVPPRASSPTEIRRRRTFAIISHPDAGKTTLTEKLLLFGGAIQLAGQVKAKKDGRNTRSDWMAIEKARGISVVTSVMTFEYEGAVFNLLDTPGHEDFSDHTYRTLTAVDSAIMVIDAAKGIEARTRKLFEVCRLRDIPIITFINKLDREAREPLELLDEIEKVLALDTAPMVWPIGKGRGFRGTYDLCSRASGASTRPPRACPCRVPTIRCSRHCSSPTSWQRWREEIALVHDAVRTLRPQGIPRGHAVARLLRQRAAKLRRARSCSTR